MMQWREYRGLDGRGYVIGNGDRQGSGMPGAEPTYVFQRGASAAGQRAQKSEYC